MWEERGRVTFIWRLTVCHFLDYIKSKFSLQYIFDVIFVGCQSISKFFEKRKSSAKDTTTGKKKRMTSDRTSSEFAVASILQEAKTAQVSTFIIYLLHLEYFIQHSIF